MYAGVLRLTNAVKFGQHPKRQGDQHDCKSEQEEHVKHMAALPWFVL